MYLQRILWRKTIEKNTLIINAGNAFLIIGATLLLIGLLINIIILVFHIQSRVDHLDSSVVAIGFLFLMLSYPFLFPKLLKGGTNDSMSTMRVSIYMIICAFVFLCVRIGWRCDAFSDFKIDGGWASIVIAALGGKAVQSIGENYAIAKKVEGQKAAPVKNRQSPFSGTAAPGADTTAAEIFDAGKMDAAPPAEPPVYIKNKLA